MDSAQLTALLAPWLPFLLEPEPNGLESAIAQRGAPTWQTAQALWTQLQPYLAAHPDLQTAIAQVATKPNSTARQALLQEEFATLLSACPELVTAIAQVMTRDRPAAGIQIDQMSGGTVAGNVQGPIFNISGSSITNLTGAGDIHYQEAPRQPNSSSKAIARRPPSSSVKIILVLAANPQGTHPLRLGAEVRLLRQAWERSPYRDDFEIVDRWAVTTRDLQQELLQYQPYIVHFCGHGVGTETPDEPSSSRKFTMVADAMADPEGLLLETETGQPQLVSAAALADLFALFQAQTECVVLNACYSQVQAEAIATHIPAVIGMKRAIVDNAAIEFAIGFYGAIFAGESVERAHKLGCNAIHLIGLPDHLTPVLHPKEHSR